MSLYHAVNHGEDETSPTELHDGYITKYWWNLIQLCVCKPTDLPDLPSYTVPMPSFQIWAGFLTYFIQS